MTMYSAGYEQPHQNGAPEEYEAQFIKREEAKPPRTEPVESVQEVHTSSDGILSKAMSLFRGLELDDILLIAIGILLLLDSDEENDVIVIFIALMLFF